jgi:hypothetical protein
MPIIVGIIDSMARNGLCSGRSESEFVHSKGIAGNKGSLRLTAETQSYEGLAS